MTESFIPSKMERWAKHINQLQIKAEAAKAAYRMARTRHKESMSTVTDAEEAQSITQTIAQEIQERIHAKIGGVVSRCLATVFEDPYKFEIIFERKRGRTEAKLVFNRDGETVDPMTASGGGPVDLAAFALRLSCMMLASPKLRRVLIMDEPFKSPSPHYREAVKQLMESLSKEMGVQFIMVTNIMELVAGDVIDLEEM